MGIIKSNFEKIQNKSNYTAITEASCDFEKIKKITGVDQRKYGSQFSQEQYDLAASVQYTFTQVYLDLIKYYLTKTGNRNLVLSGGCALNCLANSNLETLDLEDYFILPPSSDRGLSLCSALCFSEKYTLPKSMFLGMNYENNIISSIKNTGCDFTRLENSYEDCAEELEKGKVVGWYRVRSEFGPRALGNRSILANPRIKFIK